MILISGSLAYDRIMNFPGRFRDHIIPDKLHALSVSFLVDRVDEHFGGTAGNIAYSLALLGMRPTILAAAGSDFARYRAWLVRAGVDVSAIAEHRDLPTAAATIMTDREDNQIAAFHLGAMGRKSPKHALSKVEGSKVKSRKLLTSASFAIVSPGNIDDMRALPRIYKQKKIPYLYDPGQQIPALSTADLRAGITGAHALIVNDYELALVLKKTAWTKQEILKRVEMMVTTMGAKGSVITMRQENKTVTIPAAKPKAVVDPTGAGDAYRAGFLFGLTRGWPLPVVGRFASLVSVYTVERKGTQTHTFTMSGLRVRYRRTFDAALPR